MSDLSAMRTPYHGKGKVLLEEHLPSGDAMQVFKHWFEEVKGNPSVIEPNAMCLATVNKEGFPSCRMVLCKGYSPDGFKFFTHYTSRKGQDLEANDNAAATFYWAAISRSVRIEGKVEKLPMREAEEYFRQRPHSSQIGALLSDQSKPVAGREALVRIEKELSGKYGTVVPKPEKWGGYVLKPTTIEFWQGQTDRIHDRIQFIKSSSQQQQPDNKILFQGENGWMYQRLAP
ncbi:PREDICTED: pyridoxine-5'-phosphate oxidase-like isoform X2 [Nicrophorus vespilloides]|uniref:pyridoxal 5'-phosphate synthase n=1 Tax=Nicrophorus vespilloides TaxID=110193 RepID=A0ABM1NEC0_NICVS|nr:PREDICTED: pyridoxine-5'-phosphate oxidase-like isoform X2 [Nicrophorus vespilloides]